MFAVANTALLNFILGSRLLYGMSKQGLVPKFLNRVHPNFHTPHAAIFVVWCLYVILIVSGDIALLAKSTSVLLLSCFIVVNVALVVLKLKDKLTDCFEVPSFADSRCNHLPGNLMSSARIGAHHLRLDRSGDLGSLLLHSP